MTTSVPDRTESLIIVGAGGLSREAAEVARAANVRHRAWNLLGFVDDDPALAGRTIEGLPVLGPIGWLRESAPDARVIVCTGRPDNYFSRRRIVRQLALDPERYATLVHPAASVSPLASLGVGCVILAGVVVTASARVGDHVAIMPNTVITHDDVIEDFATLTSGVRLGGNVTVGTGAYLGAGALIREGVAIGPWSLIGMGSTVLSDVPQAEKWYGHPARKRGTVDLPADL